MWEGLEDGDRELMLRMDSGAPATLDEAMGQETWWYLFLRFAGASGAPYDEYARFLTQDREAAIDSIKRESGLDDENAEQYATGLFERHCEMATEELRGLYAVFPDEVQRIKAWAGTVSATDERWEAQDELGQEHSDPRAVLAFMPIEELDQGYIQSVNEYSWEAAKSAGSSSFVFDPGSGILLLGPENFTPQYVQSVRLAGGSGGDITVDTRGSTFSRGGVTVSAVGDRDAFKKAFRKVSDKSISFA